MPTNDEMRALLADAKQGRNQQLKDNAFLLNNGIGQVHDEDDRVAARRLVHEIARLCRDRGVPINDLCGPMVGVGEFQP